MKPNTWRKSVPLPPCPPRIAHRRLVDIVVMGDVFPSVDNFIHRYLRRSTCPFIVCVVKIIIIIIINNPVRITPPVSRDTPQHDKQHQFTPVRKTKIGIDAIPQIKKITKIQRREIRYITTTMNGQVDLQR
jgi:hypothetical protein